MDIFSSLVQVARGQLDDLMHSMVDEPEEKETRRERLLSDLDPSVSHDTYRFFEKLLENHDDAKQLFLSCSKVHKVQHSEPGTSFVMSKEQNLHAKSILRALPLLDKLRFELCPSVMQDNQFWEIYFTLVSEKDGVSASKDHESIELEDDSELDATPPAPDAKEVQPVASEGKDDVDTVPNRLDLNKGVKREREDEPHSYGFSDDIAVVSRLLYNGAKKTLQFAEQLIEAVDDHAGSKYAGGAAGQDPGTKNKDLVPTTGRGNKVRCTGNAPSSPTHTCTLAATNDQDSDKDKPRGVDLQDKENDSGFETDGLSVASVEDSDLKDWSRVRSKSCGSGADSDEGFQLV